MRAPLGKPFYNVAVTPLELWQGIGRELQRLRLTQKWKWSDVEAAGGPSYKTVQAIENGDIGTVESLDRCAQALGLSIVDVVYRVLETGKTPLSPEAAHVVRKFEETTVAGRTALVAMANALPRAEKPAGEAPTPAAEATPLAPHPLRPAPRAVRRRSGR